MKFYVTVESYRKLRNVFTNLNTFYIIDIDSLIAESGLNVNIPSHRFIINSEIERLIVTGAKSKRYTGIIYINSNLNFDIKEDSNGTVFFLDLITNGTGIIRDLYDNGCSYIIMREYGIDNFRELVNDTMEYIKDSCSDLSYVLKYKKLGDSTNFFFKKTIYRVKKNG